MKTNVYVKSLLSPLCHHHFQVAIASTVRKSMQLSVEREQKAHPTWLSPIPVEQTASALRTRNSHA